MKTRSQHMFNVALSVFLLAWAIVFAVLAVAETRWWLLPAVPFSLIGVLGLTGEAGRPKHPAEEKA